MEPDPIRQVAGVDLGPSLKNESSGVQMAARDPVNKVWTVARTRGHWTRRGEEARCNTSIVEAVLGCSHTVIDAPLLLRSAKEWERKLIECDDLSESMKPSYTSAILGHTWRAHSLVLEMLARDAKARFFEIFPASWFWLCEFDKSVCWKGDATAKDRKVEWFRTQCKSLKEKCGLQIEYHDSAATGDDADALPCVLCAILLAEGIAVARLDKTEPPVLFPPRPLWDEKVPESVKELRWEEYRETGEMQQQGGTLQPPALGPGG